MNYLQLAYWSFNSPVMSLGVFSISTLNWNFCYVYYTIIIISPISCFYLD